MIKVSKLKRNPNNPRQIRGEKLELLKKSVSEFEKMMSLRPMIVDENFTVLGGNMRLAAIRALGIKEIPDDWVRQATDLTDDEKREFVIKDNNSFGEYDWDAIANEWSDLPLSDWGVDLPNFEVVEEEAETKDAEAQIDKAEELNKTWQVKAGDLWQIGEHRLLCGDSTKREDVERLMNGEKAILCVTSPPYNQKLETFKPSGMQKESPNFVNRMANSYFDSMPEDEYQSQQIGLLNLLAEFLTDNGSIFYNHKIRYREKKILSPHEWLSVCNLDIRQEIIWNRSSSITMNARMFFPVDERIYWLKVGGEFVFL